MPIEPTNADRAESVRALAEQYAGTAWGDEEDMGTTVTDMICNLLHFAAVKGFDAHVVNERAMNHFRCEHDFKCDHCGASAMAPEDIVREDGGEDVFCSVECQEESTGRCALCGADKSPPCRCSEA